MDDFNLNIPEEDVKFCEWIIDRVPVLRAIWEQHLIDEFGTPLPYIFLSLAADWAEENAADDPDQVKILVSALNEGLNTGVGDVPNLVLVGFLESVNIDTPLIPLIDGALKLWHEYDLGLTDAPPSR